MQEREKSLQKGEIEIELTGIQLHKTLEPIRLFYQNSERT